MSLVEKLVVIAILLCPPAGVASVVWWELRNGRIARRTGLAAKREANPWMFWVQIGSQLWMGLILVAIAASLIAFAISN